MMLMMLIIYTAGLYEEDEGEDEAEGAWLEFDHA